MNRNLSRLVVPKTLLVLFLLSLPLVLWIFPWRRSRLIDLSSLPNPIFDARFAYSPQELLRALPGYGPDARRLYAFSELTLDFLFPLLYNPFLVIAMILIYRRAFPAVSPLHKLAFLPLGVWLADLLENASLAWLLLVYPPALLPLAWTASIFSLVKWLLGALVLLLIFAGLLSLAFAWLRKKKM
jgi:hypothetical protein